MEPDCHNQTIPRIDQKHTETHDLTGLPQTDPHTGNPVTVRSSNSMRCVNSGDSQSVASDDSDTSSANTDSTDQRSDPEPIWIEESQETFNASFHPPIPPDNGAKFQADERATLPESIQSPASRADPFPEDFDEDIPVSAEEVAHTLAFRNRVVAEWCKGERNPFVTPTVSEACLMSGSEYLDATVGPLLAQGLAEILQRRPKNPVEFLAAYLLADQVKLDAKLEVVSLTSKPPVIVPSEEESETDLEAERKRKIAEHTELSGTTPNIGPEKSALGTSPAMYSTNIKASKSAISNS